MPKASEKKLGDLHGKLANFLIDMIDGKVITEKGEQARLQGSLLNVARQFLKDNHIEQIPGKDNPLTKLGEKMVDLPEFDDDDPTLQ